MASTTLQPGAAPANAPAHSTSRRALLGAIAVAPIAALPVASLAHVGSTGAWEEALATFHRLHAEHEAACDAHSNAQSLYFKARPEQPCGSPFYVGDTVETYNERVRKGPETRAKADQALRDEYRVDETEAEEARACHAAHDALEALLATPAPGLTALATKIELAIDREVDVSDIAPLLVDLRRMAGEAAHV
jgi:hypothetical protein